MILWTGKKCEQRLRDEYNLKIPERPKQGAIMLGDVIVGRADNFNGIILSKSYIDPQQLIDAGFCVWNPDERTRYDKK